MYSRAESFREGRTLRRHNHEHCIVTFCLAALQPQRPHRAGRRIIFDVDGTLAETEGIHRRPFNAAFTDAGLDWYWDHRTYKNLLRTTGGKERI